MTRFLLALMCFAPFGASALLAAFRRVDEDVRSVAAHQKWRDAWEKTGR